MLAPPPAPGKDASGLLIAVFLAVMGGFVVTSLVAQRATAEIDSLSETLATTSAPSIQRLAALRSVVMEVELTLSVQLRKAVSGPIDATNPDAALKALNSDVQGYLTLPILAGEQPYWRDIQTGLVRFGDSASRTTLLLDAGELASAQAEFSGSLQPAAQRLIASSLRGIEFHARNSRSLASRMRETRKRGIVVSNVLTVVCVGLGLLGLLLILRQARRHRGLLRAYAEFHAARADEFEQFAGRVAHDIRNPLSAARMAGELAARRATEGAEKDSIGRILRSLSRADAITTALLEFARSGAKPDPGARTDPAEVLPDLVRGMSLEAQQLRIDIQLEPVPAVLVACAPGVYLSLAGNLMRNALKYMGDAPARTIVVRVCREGAEVRTEVSDTGPGIARENLPSLFDLYFRTTDARAKAGLGLGLATVRRLAEGHRGRVGVTSEAGKGSTFWFILPGAGETSRAMNPSQGE